MKHSIKVTIKIAQQDFYNFSHNMYTYTHKCTNTKNKLKSPLTTKNQYQHFSVFLSAVLSILLFIKMKSNLFLSPPSPPVPHKY